MKKRLIYFIFFIMLCFVINPDVYSATYRLDCHYKLDPFDGLNVGNSIWLEYSREKLSDQWQLVVDSDKKKSAWYQFVYDAHPKSLIEAGYEISSPDASLTKCPSGIEMDIDAKTIKFTNQVYFIAKQRKYTSESDISSYECEYVRNESGEIFKYYAIFADIKKDGTYQFSDLWQWNSITGKTGGVTGAKKRETQGLTYIKSETNTGEKFDDLICPQIAIDSGNKIDFISEERYNLESQRLYKDSNRICEYYENIKTEDYQYKYKYELNVIGGKILTYKSKFGVGGSDDKGTIDLKLPDGTKDCPLIFKVKWDKEYSFANKLYFYSINKDVEEKNEHCMSITSETICDAGTDNYSCVWVKDESLPNGGYCNINQLQFVACNNGVYDIPAFVPGFTSLLVNLLKIAAPIILIITSIISLLKSLAASNEDEIKKAQKSLIKKLIASALVFFVISIVQFVIMKVADDGEAGNIDDCLTCLLNNDCKTTTYYKADVYGQSICRYLSGETFECPGTKTTNTNNTNNTNNNVSVPSQNNNRVDMIN